MSHSPKSENLSGQESSPVRSDAEPSPTNAGDPQTEGDTAGAARPRNEGEALPSSTAPAGDMAGSIPGAEPDTGLVPGETGPTVLPETGASVLLDAALPSEPRAHDPYAALRLPEYRAFSIGRNLSGLGDAMQSLVVGWELYQRTGKPLTLGNVGLVQALPIVLFALLAGHVADTRPRKLVAIVAQLVFCACSVALAGFSAVHAPIVCTYIALFCAASARAFGNPARTALLPQVVPKHLITSAISWDTSIRRIAVVSGATIGGALLAATRSASAIYLINAGLGVLSVLLLTRISERAREQKRGERVTWATLAAGIHYIRHTRIILATITLDLFAVLLGGATSLLPIYAQDILRAGPGGLGELRAAPSAGALLMALTLAYIPPFRRPGRIMLWAVAGFGIATIFFGLSRSLPLSLLALFALGALDMISVVVRQTLVQTLTPDAMRGRVNAVNGVFINSSNEIGGFESGLVAQFTSPTFSVVSGGIGTLIVVGLAALVWPSIRHYEPLNSETELEG